MSRFALVDCNNFYASCERAFNPKLINKPVIVLSGNDGCVIARSNEAKALGIDMAAPFHRIRGLCRRHDVAIFSSNFSLYGDMSQRVMTCVESICPDLEIYSIDEAFLHLERLPTQNWMGFGCQLKQLVHQWTGIPISVGIGPTKTLAKIASHIAKKKTNVGVFDLSHPDSQRHWLAQFPVGEIWGIGRRWNKKLQALGINTALELKLANTQWIRSQFGVVMERTQRELNSTPCADLNHSKPRKNIVSSRSFGEMQTEQHFINEALANYTARACEKLRKQQSKASSINVFLRTSPFRPQDKQYQNSITLKLAQPTDDTTEILQQARVCLDTIFKPGYRYQKTGIMLLDLIPNRWQQNHLLHNAVSKANPQLMRTIDRINAKLANNRLFFAAQGIKRPWLNRYEHRSPRYTTQWQELLRV